jgi:YHS domain-containing protein
MGEILVKSFLLSLFSAAFFVSTALASGPEEPFAKHFNQKNNVAIQGYDVVSYFNGGPVRGLKKFSVDYRDVMFQFANQANANEFDANPEKYIPAYGGWCATALAMMGTKLDIDPKSFLIDGGVLYLFSTSMGPAKDQWTKGLPAIKQKADVNWMKIVSQ